MDPSWLELVLDSIENYQVQAKQLLEQQKALHLEAKRMLEQQKALHLQAVTGKDSAEPPAKRSKASQHGYEADGKENTFNVGSVQNTESNRMRSSSRQMKHLMDVSNLERKSSSCRVTHFKGSNGGKVVGELTIAQQDYLDHRNLSGVGQSNMSKLSNVPILPEPSPGKEKSTLSPSKINPGRGRKRGGAVKVETFSDSRNATESINVLPCTEGSERVQSNSEVPCPLAASAPLRMTRSRAKNLRNGVEHLVGTSEEAAKKSKGQRRRAKAPPQAAAGREMEEFTNIDPDVQVTEKSTRSELVFLDGTDGQSGVEHELREESMMKPNDGVHMILSGEDQPVGRKASKPKALCESMLASSVKEKQIPAIVNLQLPGNKLSGREVIKEGLSVAELGALMEHLESPDDSIRAVAQEEQVKMSSLKKEIGKVRTDMLTSIPQESHVVEGIASTPSRLLIMEPRQGTGERQSEEPVVVSVDQGEDVVIGGRSTASENVEEVMKRSRTKRGKTKALIKGATSCHVKTNAAECTAAVAHSGGEEDFRTDSLNGRGDRHDEAAEFVVGDDINNLAVGAECKVVRVSFAKPVAKSALAHEEDEVADHVVPDSWCVEAEDHKDVAPRVDGKIYREGGHPSRKVVSSATLQESTPAFETAAELKRLDKSLPHKVSRNALSLKTSFEIGDVSGSPENVEPEYEENGTVQCVEAHHDRHKECTDVRTGATREDEDDLSSADLDSERWKDIKSSVKVRKGRGKAVSSFLGYADSDLFPLRSLVLERDNIFDLALDQDMASVENAGSFIGVIGGETGSVRPFSDLLRKMEAAAFGSSQNDIRIELEFGRARTDDGEDGRHSGCSGGGKFRSSNCTDSEGLSDDAVKGRVSADTIRRPSVSLARKSGTSVPDFDEALEDEGGDTGGGVSVATPKVKSGGSGPISEFPERSADAVRGRRFHDEVKELKLQAESTEPRKFNAEIVIDLSPEEVRGTEKVLRENPRRMSGFTRGHDDGQAEQLEASAHEGLSMERKMNVTEGPKLDRNRDTKVCCDNQGLQMFVDAAKEVVPVDPVLLEALEPSVVLETKNLPAASFEQVKFVVGYHGRDASPSQDEGLRDMKLRKRPHPEFYAAKASGHKKVRSALKSSGRREDRQLDEDRIVSAVDVQEPSTSDSSEKGKDPTDGNESTLDTSATRIILLPKVIVSPWKGEASNGKPSVSSVFKTDGSRAQIFASGGFSSFKEVFSLKTPLRSQRRKIIEVSPDCQQMDPEASPSFHVPEARSCKSGSVNNRLSQSQSLRASSRVEELQTGGSGDKTHATATSPPEDLSTDVGVSGGVRYESKTASPNLTMGTTLAAEIHLHHDFASSVRAKVRKESGLKRSPYEGQYRSSQHDRFTPDSLKKNGKLGSQTKAGAVLQGQLVQENRPLHVAMSPPQQLSSENRSGDTVILSDDDDHISLKSFGPSGQVENCEFPVCSPCEHEKLSLSMDLIVQDLNPREVSLGYGLQSDLAANETEDFSIKKISRHSKHGRSLSGTGVKGVRNTGRTSSINTCESGRFGEKLGRTNKTSHSALCVEPERSRQGEAKGSGEICGSTAKHLMVAEEAKESKTEHEATATESFKEAGADVHSDSTMSIGEEDGDFGAESSGNASTESRRTTRGRSVQNHVLGAKERLDSEVHSGDSEFADEENALKEAADLTDVGEFSDGDEAGTEEMITTGKSRKQSFRSCARKSTSRKRKEQEFPERCRDFHPQDHHRREADTQCLSHSSSYGGEACSGQDKERHENSSRRTKARRTVELLCTTSDHVERDVHHSDVGDLQFKLDYQDSEIPDTKTPSYEKRCAAETSTAKEEASSSEAPRTNSNIVNPFAESTRLLSSVRTLVPVVQRPAPNFIPNGKRDVKVKALEAAEAARRLQEKREMEKRERMQRRAEAIARRAMEKEKAKEELQKSVLDSNTAKDLSAKAVLIECTHSKTLHSPKTKSTRALALKTKIEQEKAKKLEEEMKRKEEERKKKEADIFARKRKKEEAEKRDREEKRKRQEELLKQRREQEERLRAELEEKEHRHRLLEEAERERKAQEEEARRQRRAEREKERERRQKEELEAKAARQAEKEAERKRKEEAFLSYKASEEHDLRMADSMGAANTAPKLRSQLSTGLSTDKLRASNMLSTGATLSMGKAGRVPSAALEGRTHINTPMVQNKGPTSSLSGIKSQSLGTGTTTAGKNTERDSGSKAFATPSVAAPQCDTGPQSYEISPYRSSSDEDDDKPQRPKKFIPAWASKENLIPQLLRQLTQDPDEIFAGTKTCSLKEVFGTNGSKKVLDFSRRSGSGDWVKDRVLWKEELQYKIDMGYMSHIH